MSKPELAALLRDLLDEARSMHTSVLHLLKDDAVKQVVPTVQITRVLTDLESLSNRIEAIAKLIERP